VSRQVAAVVAGIVVVAAVVVGGAVLLDPFGNSAAQDSAAGDPAPARAAALDTTFEHFDGRIVRLNDWSGTPLVVNFWASWCPPCVAEMSAAFEPVHRQLGDKVAFIGLNLQDDPDDAFGVVRLTGVTYDLGRDPTGELFSAFGGFGMPTTVFVNESGVVTDTHTGALSREQLQQRIADALGVEGS
jgi:cytochrome c biogenesis protein CcmG, thiol:disulfide interchange protein DsbE